MTPSESTARRHETAAYSQEGFEFPPPEELARRLPNLDQATLDFQPRGDGTHLVLTHERFRSEPDKRDHMNGWRGCLRHLSRKFGG